MAGDAPGDLPPGAGRWHHGEPMRSRGAACLLLLALVVLGACARSVAVTPGFPRTPGDVGQPPVQPGAEEVGLASWYGPPYHGRRTASGEVYNMHDLTAAHRTLPFGTRVLAINRETEDSVEVRINDRGPFVDGRIIDLSYAAARAIDGIGPGVFPVRVRVVAAPTGEVSASPAPADLSRAAYAVQVGSFADPSRAADLRATLERDLGPGGVAITEARLGSALMYRVRVGPYPDRETARAAVRQLAERGYLGVVVER